MDEYKKLFFETLVNSVRAEDKYDVWARKSDEELLGKKYVKTREDLRKIPLIADISEVQIGDIRIIFQALALCFEVKTGVMCTVVMEMNKEGFGRVVVLADRVAVIIKFFKDAHRYGFASCEDLSLEGAKMLKNAIEIYENFQK
jgi:probable nitrogen fixation protein